MKLKTMRDVQTWMESFKDKVGDYEKFLDQEVYVCKTLGTDLEITGICGAGNYQAVIQAYDTKWDKE